MVQPAAADELPVGGLDVVGTERDGELAAGVEAGAAALSAAVRTDPVPVVADAQPATSTAALTASSTNRSDMWPSSCVRERA